MSTWTMSIRVAEGRWGLSRRWYIAVAAMAVAALLAGGCAQSEGDLSGQAGGGLPMPDQIVGQAWRDANGDGTLNAGEEPAAGVEVRLLRDSDADGTCDALDEVLATAVTDESGRYEFATVDVGSYCVDTAPGQASLGGFALDGESGVELDLPVE